MTNYVVRLCSTEYLTFQDGFWSYCIDKKDARQFPTKRSAYRALNNHRKRTSKSYFSAKVEVQDD